MRRLLLLLFSTITFSVMAQTIRNHIVQSGETLASIAKKYDVSVSDILMGNPDAKTNFYVGMVLSIPQNSRKGQSIEYIGKGTEFNYTNPVSANESATYKDSSNSTYKSEPIDGFLSFSEFSFKLSPDDKLYGFRLASSAGDTGWLGIHFGAEKVFVSHGSFVSFLGMGLSPIYSGGVLLAGFHLFPYGGLTVFEDVEYNTKSDKINYKTKTDFTYGAILDLTIGLKIASSPKGRNVYLTGSYMVTASEFKTKDAFKNGIWGIGLAWTGQ